jgi:cytochrome P450
MTNAMIALAQRPDLLERARAEVDARVGDETGDLELLSRLPFLNAVLNETMRAMTPVIGSFRIMLRDAAYAGYRIPAGWTVRLEIAGTHEDPAVWADPLAFDPERWLAGKAGEPRRPHSFIPFGGGPRVCLGASFAEAEMRVMLALLLRAYAWELLPDQDLSLRPIPFPRPRSGGLVHFTRRA